MRRRALLASALLAGIAGCSGDGDLDDAPAPTTTTTAPPETTTEQPTIDTTTETTAAEPELEVVSVDHPNEVAVGEMHA